MLRRLNKNIFYFILFFCFISLLSIYCAMPYTSSSLGNLFIKQLVWYTIGFLVMFFVVKVGNKPLFKYSYYFYFSGILLLVLLLLFGIPINNSKCWFIIPGIGSVQPSEFMKIFLLLLLSRMCANFRKEDKHSFSDEFLFIFNTFIIVLIPSILTFLQPDTGSVIIYFITYLMILFFSGINWKWFLFALLILGFILGIFGGIYFFDEELFISVFGTSFYYRIERIFMWKNGIGLQLENSLSAIGSSGLFGHGFNKTPIYLPEASTDFIFSIFASNFGFFGVLFFLFYLKLFLYLLILLVSH